MNLGPILFLYFINKYANHSQGMRQYRFGILFWPSLFLLALAAILFSAMFLNWFQTRPELFGLPHWLGVGGTVFIALYIPSYHFLKQHYPKRLSILTSLHTLGNLTAFVLVSMHFARQWSPLDTTREIGTGLILYTAVLMLVITGFSQRFHVVRDLRGWRFVHISLAVTFYLVLVIHIIHDLIGV